MKKNNLTIINNSDMIYGAFSNSLDLIIHEINFGEIKGNRIQFDMRYSLVNSDSYGMMSGTRADQIQTSGNLNLVLEITNLKISERKGRDEKIEEQIEKLDK